MSMKRIIPAIAKLLIYLGQSFPTGWRRLCKAGQGRPNVKRLIPTIVIGSLLVAGCARTKKAETQPVIPDPVEYTVPPAPIAEPVYTPAPQPAPITTPAPAPTVKSTPAPVKAAPSKPAASKTYLVKKGDTLSEIAKANKTTTQKIMALNPTIKKADAIYVGQKLKMP